MVPSNDILLASHIPHLGSVLHHVLVLLSLSIDSRLGSFDVQREGIHDDERLVLDLALHKAHDFNLST